MTSCEEFGKNAKVSDNSKVETKAKAPLKGVLKTNPKYPPPKDSIKEVPKDEQATEQAGTSKRGRAERPSKVMANRKITMKNKLAANKKVAKKKKAAKAAASKKKKVKK